MPRVRRAQVEVHDRRGAERLSKARNAFYAHGNGTPRSVELRCEAFVFFPSVDFYSRPREMRPGGLPRLRPPRVESWRARRGGLEGAGESQSDDDS